MGICVKMMNIIPALKKVVLYLVMNARSQMLRFKKINFLFSV